MTHITDAFSSALTTAIERIIACMDGLDRDEINWKPVENVTNSLYVLAVHTMANAEQTVVSMLGGENLPRDRDSEFAAVGESADWVHDRWATLKPALQYTLAGLSAEDLERQYEHPRRGKMTGWEALVMVVTHANEHVGHAELTRDLLKAK
jgi:uncharacterized damage-inducible protein DinB